MPLNYSDQVAPKTGIDTHLPRGTAWSKSEVNSKQSELTENQNIQGGSKK